MAELRGSSIFWDLKFDFSVLRIPDSKLRIDDQVSLLFLLFEDSSEALRVTTLIIEAQEQASKPVYGEILLIWAQKCGLSWRQRLVEALIIIGSFDLLSDLLNLDSKTIDQLYPLNSFQTVYIHPIKKFLYTLSESLVQDETDKIIFGIHEIFHHPSLKIEQMDTIFFEVFLLKLINCGFMELGAWNTSSARKANVQNLIITLLHFEFMEAHNLLIAIENNFNELKNISQQTSHAFEFKEDQSIIAARFSFNAWVDKGLNTAISKMYSASSKDKGELLPSCSLNAEETVEGQSSEPKEIVDEPEQPGEAQGMIEESVDDIEQLMHYLNVKEITEGSSHNPTSGYASSEKPQKADDLRQAHEEPMDLVVELENMNLHDEDLFDSTQALSTNFSRGECYPIPNDGSKIYFFMNCYEHENYENPLLVKGLKTRHNAVIEEEHVTEVFRSLDFNVDYIMNNLEHTEAEYAIQCREALKDNPSLFVFIMICYGFKGSMISVDGRLIRRDYLERMVVNLPELVGKPKVLIIQTYILDDISLPKPPTSDGPDMTDLLSLWVAIPYQMKSGNGSQFESELTGVSMFVKTLCDHLEAMDKNKDFVSLCKDVCLELSIKTNGLLMPICDSYMPKFVYLK